MKKLALSSLLALFVVSSANAATTYFVGGSAGIRTNDDSNTTLAVAPEFGWKYNSDWDLGVMANFGYTHKDTIWIPARAGWFDASTYAYGAGAFARYKVAQIGGLKLLLKGTVGVDFVTYDPKMAGADSETLTSINAGVIPMITYDVSEAFTLYANLNFLGVNAGYTFENKDFGQSNTWDFRAVADTNDVANTGRFQIGFNYNF